ncbi:hypothetical protein M2407_002822 [Serratia sp. BIGb0234]|nr:hypothetical protein [Serratia sp. BIGb0234]
MKKKLKTHRSVSKKNACCCGNVKESVLRRFSHYVPAMYALYKFSNDLHPHFWSLVGTADWHALKEVLNALISMN